jgi:hypothetical protein
MYSVVQSSILVGVNGPAVWVRVEGKGNFLNSGSLKQFAQEMVNRGYREFVFDLEHCAMMDSTFMGTMSFIVAIVAANFFPDLGSTKFSKFARMVRPPRNAKR